MDVRGEAMLIVIVVVAAWASAGVCWLVAWRTRRLAVRCEALTKEARQDREAAQRLYDAAISGRFSDE